MDVACVTFHWGDFWMSLGHIMRTSQNVVILKVTLNLVFGLSVQSGELEVGHSAIHKVFTICNHLDVLRSRH